MVWIDPVVGNMSVNSEIRFATSLDSKLEFVALSKAKIHC